MMFALAAPLLAWASSTPSMYGVSMKSSLVTIDMTSGKMTELGTEHSEELEAQELSAIDAKRGRYYTMGVDTTNQTNTVVMVVWNLLLLVIVLEAFESSGDVLSWGSWGCSSNRLTPKVSAGPCVGTV